MATESERVAHVWRRLGFGPSPGDTEAGVAAGGATAVIDQLLARPVTTAADWQWPTETGAADDADRFLTRLFTLWARSPGQLQERVSWILANLLVVGPTKSVQFKELKQHHNRLRGWPSATSYKALLQDVANSTPVQLYLTGVWSSPPHPNENLARELMELFSLGVQNPRSGATNYTESDVKEIARALTGYRWNSTTKSTYFDSAFWDSGSKTFLGASRGAAKLPEVVSAITAHNGFKYFVPQRLYRELMGFDPSSTALDEMANVWGPSGDIRALVSHIAHRPEFLADSTIHNRVKSPVELFVTTLKVLDVEDASHWNLARMSWWFRQHPLVPPDVAGWGDAWLHPSYIVIWSYISSWYVSYDKGPSADGTTSATPVAKQSKTIRRLFAEADRSTAADTALRLAGLHDVSSQTRGAIDAYARSSAWTGEPWSWTRACGVMQMVLNSPEFLAS